MRTREQIREREKRGKEVNGLYRKNKWMSKALRSEAADEQIGARGTSG